MSIMTADEMREMSTEELEEKIDEWQLEISKERAQVEVGGAPENPGRIGEMKRTIARARTVINER